MFFALCASGHLDVQLLPVQNGSDSWHGSQIQLEPVTGVSSGQTVTHRAEIVSYSGVVAGHATHFSPSQSGVDLSAATQDTQAVWAALQNGCFGYASAQVAHSSPVHIGDSGLNWAHVRQTPYSSCVSLQAALHSLSSQKRPSAQPTHFLFALSQTGAAGEMSVQLRHFPLSQTG